MSGFVALIIFLWQRLERWGQLVSATNKWILGYWRRPLFHISSQSFSARSERSKYSLKVKPIYAIDFNEYVKFPTTIRNFFMKIFEQPLFGFITTIPKAMGNINYAKALM